MLEDLDFGDDPALVSHAGKENPKTTVVIIIIQSILCLEVLVIMLRLFSSRKLFQDRLDAYLQPHRKHDVTV